jgi:sec-independent protein translocase protein TatA
MTLPQAGESMFQTLAWVPGPWEWIIIVVVALLIFGRRLPEVGKSLGKGIVEFKKGLKGVKDELEDVDRDIDQRRPPRSQATRWFPSGRQRNNRQGQDRSERLICSGFRFTDLSCQFRYSPLPRFELDLL